MHFAIGHDSCRINRALRSECQSARGQWISGDSLRGQMRSHREGGEVIEGSSTTEFPLRYMETGAAADQLTQGNIDRALNWLASDGQQKRFINDHVMRSLDDLFRRDAYAAARS